MSSFDKNLKYLVKIKKFKNIVWKINKIFKNLRK